MGTQNIVAMPARFGKTISAREERFDNDGREKWLFARQIRRFPERPRRSLGEQWFVTQMSRFELLLAGLRLRDRFRRLVAEEFSGRLQ